MFSSTKQPSHNHCVHLVQDYWVKVPWLPCKPSAHHKGRRCVVNNYFQMFSAEESYRGWFPDTSLLYLLNANTIQSVCSLFQHREVSCSIPLTGWEPELGGAKDSSQKIIQPTWQAHWKRSNMYSSSWPLRDCSTRLMSDRGMLCTTHCTFFTMCSWLRRAVLWLMVQEVLLQAIMYMFNLLLWYPAENNSLVSDS